MIDKINIGKYIEIAINWLTDNFASFFDALNAGVGGFISGLQSLLIAIPFWLIILGLAFLAWRKAGKGVAIFSVLGLLLIYGMGFWEPTMETLALVLSSTFIALLLGIPLGVWSAYSDRVNQIMRPILDFMQTMPAFVYLIPAVLFFGLGAVPGAFATVIFAMPPVVRLTGLGIRQVPTNIVEATTSLGATRWQLLFKVQLPLALPTILTGVNQTIMMSLSMVVIAAMIAAGGLGQIVLEGISQMKIGLGFEGGIAVVILAIILDRITQGLTKTNKKTAGVEKSKKGLIARVAGISVVVLAAIFFFAFPSKNSDDKKITIAYVNWAEGIAMTNLAKLIFEEQGYDVQLKNADVAPIFAALAKKDADVFLDSWMPVTHQDYMRQYGDSLEQLGVLFDDASIGLVVPTYVDINSIEELNQVKDKFNSEVVGIDAGAGVMRATDEAINAYNLDFKLLSSTGPMMTASLKRAIDENKWVVVTGWKPHWKFSRFDLKILEDPKNIFGEAEFIYSIARKGFKEEDPFAAELIANMKFTGEQISSLMSAVDEADTEALGAKEWLEKHRDVVESWIPDTAH